MMAGLTSGGSLTAEKKQQKRNKKAFSKMIKKEILPRHRSSFLSHSLITRPIQVQMAYVPLCKMADTPFKRTNNSYQILICTSPFCILS